FPAQDYGHPVVNRPHHSLGSVVMIVNDSTRFSSGLRHTSHNPAQEKGWLVFRCPHIGTLRLPSLLPLIETVSGNNTAASIDERLEGRQLCQCLGSRVYHTIADRRVCRPMRDQTPMHK